MPRRFLPSAVIGAEGEMGGAYGVYGDGKNGVPKNRGIR